MKEPQYQDAGDIKTVLKYLPMKLCTEEAQFHFTTLSNLRPCLEGNLYSSSDAGIA